MGRPQIVASPLAAGRARTADPAAPAVRGTLRKALDMACAVLLLVPAAPLMLAAAVAVRLGSHGPVLHRERVVGERGRAVAALSFRVMVDGGATAAHESLRAVVGAAGRQPFAGPGRLLRATRGDRLPRLLNVAAGQLPLF